MTTALLASEPRPAWSVLGLALAGALALSACGSDDSAEFDDGDTEATGQTEETETEQDDGEEQSGADQGTADDAGEENSDEQEGSDEGTDPAEPEGSGLVDPADALETVTYSIPEESIDGEITVGVHHLRVEGQTMELLLTFTPEFTGNDAYSLWHLHGRNHANVPPELYDRDNLKRYSILRSGPGFNQDHWATSHDGVNIASGETLAYRATFATPEDDIDTINVGIPVAPEFKDVEIDWGDGEPAENGVDEDDQ